MAKKYTFPIFLVVKNTLISFFSRGSSYCLFNNLARKKG